MVFFLIMMGILCGGYYGLISINTLPYISRLKTNIIPLPIEPILQPVVKAAEYEYGIYNDWIERQCGTNTECIKYATDIHILWDRMGDKLSEFNARLHARDVNIHFILNDIVSLENELATLFHFIVQSRDILADLTSYNKRLNEKLLQLINKCTWVQYDMIDMCILPANL